MITFGRTLDIPQYSPRWVSYRGLLTDGRLRGGTTLCLALSGQGVTRDGTAAFKKKNYTTIVLYYYTIIRLYYFLLLYYIYIILVYCHTILP